MNIEDAVNLAYSILRKNAPYDTGNLKYNAIKIERVSPTEMRIKIDANIAPYAVYTNEPWVSSKWNGKKNPNEAWIDKSVKEIVVALSARYKGRFEKTKERNED